MKAKKYQRVAEEKKQEPKVTVNSLSDTVMGYGNNGTPQQLSQTDTIFLNNRWYLISNMRQVLSQAYVEHGLIQTVVDVPVDDGMRDGITIKTKQLSPEEIEKLQALVDRESLMTDVVGQALKWNRLFGGAGIVIITDQDPTTPLNLDAINKDSSLEFRAVDMWELFWDKQNTEGYDPTIQEHGFEFYSYYGIKLHKSRVMRMKGLTAPSFIRPRLRGWGFSIVEAFVRSINQYLKANDLSFEVLDEFKIDVYKIRGLSQALMTAEGTTAVQKRVFLANQQKNFQNAISMDSEDDYSQKQVSFSGLAEMMREIRLQIASDLRMPLTKIFGEGTGGFSSGEDGIENYNAMVESTVRNKCKYEIIRCLEILCKKEFGFIPTDISIEFSSLRTMTSEQEENVKTQKFNRLLQAKQANEITSEEFRDACNKDQLLGIDLKKGVDLFALQEGDAAIETNPDKAVGEAPTTDTDANRPDSQKSKAMDDE